MGNGCDGSSGLDGDAFAVIADTPANLNIGNTLYNNRYLTFAPGAICLQGYITATSFDSPYESGPQVVWSAVVKASSREAGTLTLPETPIGQPQKHQWTAVETMEPVLGLAGVGGRMSRTGVPSYQPQYYAVLTPDFQYPFGKSVYRPTKDLRLVGGYTTLAANLPSGGQKIYVVSHQSLLIKGTNGERINGNLIDNDHPYADISSNTAYITVDFNAGTANGVFQSNATDASGKYQYFGTITGTLIEGKLYLDFSRPAFSAKDGEALTGHAVMRFYGPTAENMAGIVPTGNYGGYTHKVVGTMGGVVTDRIPTAPETGVR